MEITDELLDTVKSTARNIVEKLGHEHSLMLFVVSHRGVSIISLSPLPPWLIKDTIINTLHALDATSYILIGEAISMYSKYTREFITGKINIGDIPLDDRTHMLVIVHAKKGKSYNAFRALVTEIDDGRSLSQWKDMELPSDIFGLCDIKDW